MGKWQKSGKTGSRENGKIGKYDVRYLNNWENRKLEEMGKIGNTRNRENWRNGGIGESGNRGIGKKMGKICEIGKLGT